MVTRYYEVRGWTAEGHVPREQMETLGLDDLV
jgi:aldehyde:ferredoxin oxidoreductase